MERVLRRVKTLDEKEERELGGFWKAIALVKDIGESRQRVTLEVLLSIHKTIFRGSYPEIAGRFRKDGEDIKKLKCTEPPPGRLVAERMYSFWREFDFKISKILLRPYKINSKKSRRDWILEVVSLAAWVQHQIAAIHPFIDGNGRIARLITKPGSSEIRS